MARLNTMCSTCDCLNRDCVGTTCQDWTGCIYRRASKAKEVSDVYQPLISRETMEARKILPSKLR